MIDSMAPVDRMLQSHPVVFNEREMRSVMIRVGIYIGVACIAGLAFLIGYGPSWVIGYFLLVWLGGWLANTLALTEWTIAGGELGRRRWFSRPGSRPTLIMGLGPHVECVHETRGRWRVWPGGAAIDLLPGQAARLATAMEAAGVRIDDRRGEWVRRHRLLDAAGLLAYAGAFVAEFVAIAIGALARPLGAVLVAAGIAGLLAGLLIEVLPWEFRERPARPTTADEAGGRRR